MMQLKRGIDKWRCSKQRIMRKEMGGVHERVQKYRKKLRREGMRPIQIWVSDTRRAGFAEECKRQSTGWARPSGKGTP